MNMPPDAAIWILGYGGILVTVVVIKWLTILQRRVSDHAERIAWLEARDGKDREDHR